jgi:hypothetical protein
MATEHVTDHADRAVARLRQQYKDKTNIEAWLRILVAPIQRLEDALWQLLTMRGIDEAEGVQLDALGKIVGQPRDGRSDSVYRRFIRARIATNKSNGAFENILTVTRLVLDDDDITLVLGRSGTAHVVMRLDGAPVTSDLAELLVVFFMRKTVAAGVRIIVEYSEVEDASMFKWDATSWDGGLQWSNALD